MPDTPGLRSLVEAAERAAAAGDYASAEPLLREVARLQETSLGRLHPDLANTLNNLGVVCEITGNTADAERYFRQAWAIAAAVLAPDHPFVATSRKNLEDFCTARGKAVDTPTPPPAVDGTRRAWEAGCADRQPQPPSRGASQPVVSKGRSRPLAIGALIVGILFVTLMATALWFRSSPDVEPSSRGRPGASSPNEPRPTDVPNEVRTGRRGPGGAEPRAHDTTTTPVGQQVGKAPSVPPTAEPRTTSASAPQSPVVAGAYLCRDLSTAEHPAESGDWQCLSPSLPISPGPLFFYTRLKSPTDTTVQHRWYCGNRLRQVVELRIRANTTSGYRTYSRSTVYSQDAGDWRVELRTGAGALLHEERFVVR